MTDWEFLGITTDGHPVFYRPVEDQADPLEGAVTFED